MEKHDRWDGNTVTLDEDAMTWENSTDKIEDTMTWGNTTDGVEDAMSCGNTTDAMEDAMAWGNTTDAMEDTMTWGNTTDAMEDAMTWGNTTDGMEAEVGESAAPTFDLGDATSDPQFNLIVQLVFWWYVVVIPGGVVGNILTVLVATRPRNRTMSCSVYMAGLALADLVVLVSQGSTVVISHVLRNVLPQAQLRVLCQACTFMLYSAAFGDVLIILALLVERVVAVTWPFKATVYFSPRRATAITVAIAAVTLIYNVPVYLSTTFHVNCVAVPTPGLAYSIYHMSKIVLCGLVPFVGILTMNCMILCAVKKSRGRRKTGAMGNLRTVSGSGSSVELESTSFDNLPESAPNKPLETEPETEPGKPSETDCETDPETEPEKLSEAEPEPKKPSETEPETEPEKPSKSERKNPSETEPNNQTKPGTEPKSLPDTEADTPSLPEAMDGDPATVEDVRPEVVTMQRHVMRKRERQLTLMMVVVSLAFLLLTLPKYCHQLAFTNIVWNRSRQMRLVFGWSGAMSQLCYILNSAVNLLLYAMTGSKFRADLTAMCRCR